MLVTGATGARAQPADADAALVSHVSGSATAGGAVLCAAVTGANGVATCNPGIAGELAIIVGGGFTATFAGSLNYQASSDRGAFLRIG